MKKIVKIEACGISVEVGRVVYEDVYENWEGQLVVDLEFYDKQERPHHYKSYYDKGTVTFDDGSQVTF